MLAPPASPRRSQLHAPKPPPRTLSPWTPPTAPCPPDQEDGWGSAGVPSSGLVPQGPPACPQAAPPLPLGTPQEQELLSPRCHESGTSPEWDPSCEGSSDIEQRFPGRDGRKGSLKSNLKPVLREKHFSVCTAGSSNEKKRKGARGRDGERAGAAS